VTFLISSSHAQSSDKFVTYTNNDLGFSIEHPSDWKFEEYPKDNPIEVYFTIRENKEDVVDNDTESLPASIFDSRFTISVEQPIKTKTVRSLANRVQFELDKFDPPEYNLIRQNEVTIGGNDGWKIEFRHTAPDLNYDRHIFEIITKANGKFYNLQYIEDPLKVPETLPLANKMVESFRIKE
jgi:PsbP